MRSPSKLSMSAGQYTIMDAGACSPSPQVTLLGFLSHGSWSVGSSPQRINKTPGVIQRIGIAVQGLRIGDISPHWVGALASGLMSASFPTISGT
jgi:hypothetical protein